LKEAALGRLAGDLALEEAMDPSQGRLREEGNDYDVSVMLSFSTFS
jgi:hypothetical protein